MCHSTHDSGDTNHPTLHLLTRRVSSMAHHNPERVCMNGHFVPAENHLIDCLRLTARGPRQNGIFALWLLVRTCDDALTPSTLSTRANRRRLDAMTQRWSSLSLQPAFKKALAQSVAELSPGAEGGPLAALQNLVDPTREYLGQEAADALTLAVRSARKALRQQRATT